MNAIGTNGSDHLLAGQLKNSTIDDDEANILTKASAHYHQQPPKKVKGNDVSPKCVHKSHALLAWSCNNIWSLHMLHQHYLPS